MGNCLFGQARRTEKATKLAESKVAEYQMRYDAAHLAWENAVRVRAQAVLQLPKHCTTKSERVEFVKTSKAPSAVSVRDAHAKVQRTERELNTANHMLSVARKALQMAQSSAVAHETKKMVQEFNKLLPQTSNLDDVSKHIDEFVDTGDVMNELHDGMEDAFQGIQSEDTLDEESDWLAGGALTYSDDDEHVAEFVPDRKVSAETHAPSAPRVSVRAPLQRVELLE